MSRFVDLLDLKKGGGELKVRISPRHSKDRKAMFLAVSSVEDHPWVIQPFQNSKHAAGRI